jgi:hypothetical protein
LSNEIVYGIGGGLTQGMIRQIHEGALQIIERIGLLVPHAGIRKLLAEHEGSASAATLSGSSPFWWRRRSRSWIIPNGPGIWNGG